MVMEFYRSALGAIKTELAKEKLDLLVTIPHESGGSELPHWRIDAAIIIQQCQLRTIEELHQHSYPHVVLNGILDDQTPAVLADDVQGMRLVIDHLYGLGHRRIAYAKNANDQDSDHYSIALRHDAYKAEMAARGLPCIDPYDPAVVPVGADFLKRTVLEQQATAIVGYSHAEAMTLMQAAMAMGIAIPSQLSLVCFNDMYPLSFMSIPLTMVRIPTEEMGQAAAQLLLKMLKNDCQTRRLTFPEELIVRASTAEPVR